MMQNEMFNIKESFYVPHIRMRVCTNEIYNKTFQLQIPPTFEATFQQVRQNFKYKK